MEVPMSARPLKRVTKRKARLAGPLLLLSIMIFGICIAEIVARLVMMRRVSFSVQLKEGGNPAWRIREADGTVVYHRPLLDTYPFKKNASTLRICFLGDSMTAGGEVSPEERFTALLEEWLNERAERAHPGTAYEVLNLGVPGYNLVQIAEVFDESLQLAPDLFIYNYVGNDHQTVRLRDGPGGQSEVISYDHVVWYPLSFPGNGLLLSSSWLYRLISDRLAHFLDEVTPTFQPKIHHVGSDAARAALMEMLAEAEEGEIPFVIMLSPVFDGQEVHGERAVPVLRACYPPTLIWNVTRNLEGFQARDLRISDSDSHPNTRGHKAIAEALKPYFDTYVLNTSLEHLVPGRGQACSVI